MQIFVKGLDGESFPVEILEGTVDEVMRGVEEAEGVPLDMQRLAFEGRQLQPGHQLAAYNVQEHSTLHLSMELGGGHNVPWPGRLLAMWHLLNKQICRKCYGRLSPAATRCSKAKCGRTTDIRPKKLRIGTDRSIFAKKFTRANYVRGVQKYPYLIYNENY